MRFLSVSLVLLALAWSRALTVQGAPAVDQESSLARRSGDYQGLEIRRDISLERRDTDVLTELVNLITGLLAGVSTALKAPVSATSALAVRAVPPSVSSSMLPTTSNRTITKSGALGAVAVQTTTGTISSTSSKSSSTTPASSAPVTRRQLPVSIPLPPLPVTLPLPPLPVSLPVPPPAAQSGNPTNVATSTTSHLTSTTSTAKTSAGPV